MRALLAIVAVALAQPVVAQTIAIPFAPPTDRALSYSIEQHRPVEGVTRVFSATRDLRFARAADGYTLDVTLRSIDSDAPAAGAEPYRAALTPLIGVTVRFRLDGKGRIVAADDLEAAWGKVQAGIDAMLEKFPPDTPRHKAAANVQALFASLSAEGRLALLAGEVQPLFLFAGSDVTGGEGRGLRTMAGSPLGRPVPVEGTLRVAGQTAGALDLEEKLAGEAIQVGITYHLSRLTGLVEKQQRSLAVGTLGLTESRTLTPFD